MSAKENTLIGAWSHKEARYGGVPKEVHVDHFCDGPEPAVILFQYELPIFLVEELVIRHGLLIINVRSRIGERLLRVCCSDGLGDAHEFAEEAALVFRPVSTGL